MTAKKKAAWERERGRERERERDRERGRGRKKRSEMSCFENYQTMTDQRKGGKKFWAISRRKERWFGATTFEQKNFWHQDSIMVFNHKHESYLKIVFLQSYAYLNLPRRGSSVGKASNLQRSRVPVQLNWRGLETRRGIGVRKISR